LVRALLPRCRTLFVEIRFRMWDKMALMREMLDDMFARVCFLSSFFKLSRVLPRSRCCR
jgi:hypothetical protein